MTTPSAPRRRGHVLQASCASITYTPNNNSSPQSEYLQAAKYRDSPQVGKGSNLEKFQVRCGVRDDTYCTKATRPCPPDLLCEHYTHPQTIIEAAVRIFAGSKISRGLRGHTVPGNIPGTRKNSKSGTGCATTTIVPKRCDHALQTSCASITHVPKQ